MRSTTIWGATLLALSQTALADFRIFCGYDNQGFDGNCLFANNPLSCSDVSNSVVHYSDPQRDVSGDFTGLVCDGCDISKNARDWDITRLEWNDSGTAYFGGWGDGAPHHWTIYSNGDSISFVDTNGNSLGTCTKPSAPQEVDCSADFVIERFDCSSSLTLLDSVN